MSNTGKPSHRNSVGLLFLIIPIGTMVWAAKTGRTLPVNHADLLVYGLPVLIGLFAVIWWVAYGADQKDRSLMMVTVFFALLWFIGGFFFLAKINSFFSAGEMTSYYRSITAARVSSSMRANTTPGVGSVSRSCQLTIAPPLAGTAEVHLAAGVCDLVTAGTDGIELKVGAGLLLPWIADHVVIKDFATYKSRLGIDDTTDTGK